MVAGLYGVDDRLADIALAVVVGVHMAGGRDGPGLRLAAGAGAGLHAVRGAGGGSGHGPGAEIMGVDAGLNGHIAHVVQAGLAVCEAVVRRQGVVALLGGHAVQLAAGNVLEAAAGYIEAGKGVQDGEAVLHEAAVSGGVDAQSRQRYDDLGAGLAVHGAPACKAAVAALHGRQGLQGLIHGGLDRLVGLVVGGQGLDGHGGHVRVGGLAGEGPAAVSELRVQDDPEQLLPGHIAHSGIVVAVQGDEGPDGAVDALLLHVGHVVQALEQVVAAHVGHVLADGRQGQDDAGVVGDLGPVQTLVGVGLGLHILHHGIIVPSRHGAAGAGQADGHPLAAHGADTGGAEFTHVVAGGLVDLLQALALLGQQLGIGSLGGGELVVILDLGLLGLRQGLIGIPGGRDGVLGPQGHLADGIDEVLHSLGGLQDRQPGLGGGELVIVLDLGLLGLRQSLIGIPGGNNGTLGLQGHLADGVDLIVHSLGSLQIGQASLGGSELVIALDLGLLGLRQCLIGSPGSGDGLLGLQGHLADGIDHVVLGLGGLQIGQASLGGGELVIVGNLSLLGLRQCPIGSPGGGDGLLGRQGHLADGVNLLYDIVYMPALQLQGQGGQCGENPRRFIAGDSRSGNAVALVAVAG